MKKGIIYTGIVAIGIIFLLLTPGTVLAQSCQNKIAGTLGGGEDPHGSGQKKAMHPQDDSWENYVVSVYSMETNQPDPNVPDKWVWNVRVAISVDNGQSWSIFQWVDLDVSVDQDYPDVHIVKDTVQQDKLKLIVVWQEKAIDGSTPWTIKAREKASLSSQGDWRLIVYTVSETGDTQNNVYPKIATCSLNSITYWNVVWQRYYNTYGTFGVKLNTYTLDQYWGGFMTQPQDIAAPSSSIEEYKNPAIDCMHSGYNEKLYIIYDVKLPLVQDPNGPPIQPYRVRVESGTFNFRGPYSRSNGPFDLDECGSDFAIGFPDIAVVGDTGGLPGNTIDCVWMYSFGGNNNVRYSRSCDGGQSYAPTTTISPNGCYGTLRCVAIDMVKILGSPNRYQTSVVWTNGNNIKFMKRMSSGGTWNSNFNSEETWTSTENIEDFVDVAVKGDFEGGLTIYSDVVWQESQQAVWYARDP